MLHVWYIYLLGDFVRANVVKYSVHGAYGNVIELDIFNETNIVASAAS